MLRILFSEVNRVAKGPAIFLDRDGVINCRRPGDYVLDWSQFVFLPGIHTALKQLVSLGLPMIVISNQAAVGKGLLDPARLEEITVSMQQALLEEGTPLAAAYYCTHRSDENCVCRKPKPGLLLEAASDFNIDLPRSIFIGDSETDVKAAQAAGSRPLLFGLGLQVSSDTADWKSKVPSATSAQTLFRDAVGCLGAETPMDRSDRSTASFGRDN